MEMKKGDGVPLKTAVAGDTTDNETSIDADLESVYPCFNDLPDWLQKELIEKNGGMDGVRNNPTLNRCL